MIKFAQYFLENKDIKNESELKTMQLLTSVVYECVTQDKLGILPMWIMVLKVYLFFILKICKMLGE